MFRNEVKPNAEIKLRFRGRFKLEAFKQDDAGNEIPGTRKEVGWFDNLITDTGLNNIGLRPSQCFRGCQVGSGSTAPNVTDTALVSRIGSSVDRFATSSGRNYTDPLNRFLWFRRTYRFAPGVATGNVSEVAVVYGSNDGGSDSSGAMHPNAMLLSRALVLDDEGNPTTVPVLADETLDVSYEFRIYIPDNVDVTGTLTFNGVVTNWTLRNCEVNNNPEVNAGGWLLGGAPSYMGLDFTYRQSVGFGENVAYVGATSGISAETGFPTGTARGMGPGGGEGFVSNVAYISGTHYIDFKHNWGLATAGTGINDPNGIGAARFVTHNMSWQVGFTPRIAKTGDMVLDYTMRLSWARYVP